MSTRCKPGDLAIILYDVPQCTANIGRVVQVAGPLRLDPRGQLTWLIKPATPGPYLIDNFINDKVRFMDLQDDDVEHPDAWMLPIQPDGEIDEIDEFEELEV